jgi:hypothetical protein
MRVPGKAAACCCCLKSPSACGTARCALLLLRRGSFVISLTLQLFAGVAMITMATACVAWNFTARLCLRVSHTYCQH